MNSATRRCFAIALAAAWILPMLPLAVASHDPDYFYRAVWTSDGANDRVPQWKIATNVPAGDHRQRLLDAAADWNSLQQYPELDYTGTTTELNYSTPCTELAYQENSAEWGEFSASPEPLGETTGCYDFADGRIRSFQIKLNDDTNWYTGAAGSGITGTSKYDLQGLMAREFGHAHGRVEVINDGHFSELDETACPASYGTRHTNCPTLSPGVAGWRNFETHDKSTHLGAYY